MLSWTGPYLRVISEPTYPEALKLWLLKFEDRVGSESYSTI